MSNELSKEQIKNAYEASCEAIAQYCQIQDFFKAIAPHLQYQLDGWLRLCKEYSCNQTPEALGACFARQRERLEAQIKTLQERLSEQTQRANQFGREASEAKEQVDKLSSIMGKALVAASRNHPKKEDPAIKEILSILSEFGCSNEPLARRLADVVRKADASQAGQ